MKGEMVMRVAEALRSVRTDSRYMSDGDLTRVQIDGYFDLTEMAKVAILAMMEPTEEMEQVANVVEHIELVTTMPLLVSLDGWKAMVKEAAR